MSMTHEEKVRLFDRQARELMDGTSPRMRLLNLDKAKTHRFVPETEKTYPYVWVRCRTCGLVAQRRTEDGTTFSCKDVTCF